MEPKNGGWVQMIFLFKGVIFRFQSLVFGGMHLFPFWIIMNHSYRWLKTSSEMQVDDFWPAAVKMISDMGFLQSLLLVKRCVVWRWWWEGYSPQELRYPTLGKGGNHFQQCPWKWDMSVFPVRGICFWVFWEHQTANWSHATNEANLWQGQHSSSGAGWKFDDDMDRLNMTRPISLTRRLS